MKDDRVREIARNAVVYCLARPMPSAEQSEEYIASTIRAALAQENAWVPVTERLPDLEKPVWGLLKSGSIAVFARVDGDDGWLWANSYGSAWFCKGKWEMDMETDDDYDVVMWKDLPLPPENSHE